jgi:tetratricopeptide (TPR) repeat protein
MNIRGVSAVLCSLLVWLTSAFAGQKPWTEVRSQHFRVLTNGSTGQARKVAYEFEQLRYVFSTRFANARLQSGAPLIIFATSDAATAQKLDPNAWKLMKGNLGGFFHHSWEKQFALIRLDTFGGNGAKEVVYHEYAHTIQHLNSHWLPVWLDEGMAEFYGYTRFENHKIYLGAPTERVRMLRSRNPDPVEAILTTNHRSPLYGTEFFYAESWALVHFLIYGPGMDGGRKLDQFFDLLQQRVDQKKAFQQVFGDFAILDKQLASYMLQPTFTTTVLKNSPQIDENSFASRSMTVAETEAELGAYHLWVRDRSEARSLIEQSLLDDPKFGLAHEDMAFLDFSQGKDAEATKEFEQAFAVDGSLYLSLFYRIMLSPQATSNAVADMNSFGASLGKVLQLNPDFAPAYVQLARLALRENDLPSALAVARKAEELEPSRAGYHLFTGKIMNRMGKGPDAAASAKFVADRWSGPDRNEAVELWNDVPASQRPAGDSLVETAPTGTQTVEGKVKSVTCGEQDQGWSFLLDHDGQALTFHRKGGFAAGYSDTLWNGGDHFSLCHHIEGLRAIIRFHNAADASYAGDVAEIEIRDDLPDPIKQSAMVQRQNPR